MSKEQPETMPEFTELLRELTRQLAQAITDVTRGFEKSTGLEIEGIELIRRMDLGKPSSSVEDATRIASTKVNVRI